LSRIGNADAPQVLDPGSVEKDGNRWRGSHSGSSGGPVAAGVGRWVAVVLLLVSLLDLGVLWWPVRLGDMNWEFGTVSATVDALPLPTLALFGLLIIAILRGQSGWGIPVGVVFGALVLLLTAMLAVHALNLPLLARAVEEPLAREAVQRAALKTIATLLAYLVLYVAGTRYSLKLMRRR